MPDPVLIDTGPLVACFCPDDQDHQACVEKLRLLKGQRLVTSLAIVTEVLFLLDFSIKNQLKFLQFLASGVVEMEEITGEDFLRIAVLMGKYQDCPMDFADATLVALAERLHTRRIFTLDRRDFSIYRNDRGHAFHIV